MKDFPSARTERRKSKNGSKTSGKVKQESFEFFSPYLYMITSTLASEEPNPIQKAIKILYF